MKRPAPRVRSFLSCPLLTFVINLLPMRLARWTFLVAGIWGVLVLTPLFFLERRIGEQYPPVITHPEFYYGFIAVALAAQFMFLIIGTDPIRYRPLMLVAMWEKFSAVAAVTTLGFMNRVTSPVVSGIVVDFALGVLFVIAWLKTRPQAQQQAATSPK